MPYTAKADRYQSMPYRRLGQSGLLLPAVSLGLWHSFGEGCDYQNAVQLCTTAFDLGITHFDLANNYGPPYGAAEQTFGRILREQLHAYRDELIVSTKAGYDMWPGPYGNWGSRKYLLASLDQSLRRLGLEYVDIFYHHRPDPETPLEETMGALAQAVRSGKALYAGISNYGAEDTARAAAIMRRLGCPLVVNQSRYSMLDRTIERDQRPIACAQEGLGMVCFSPLAQGLLSQKYLKGIPADSRAARDGRYLKAEMIAPPLLARIRALDEVAQGRGQTLPQMALSWVLQSGEVTSVLIGASRPGQIAENVRGVLDAPAFTPEQLAQIDEITLGEDGPAKLY